ncbi:MAG: hypothetical protein AAGG51_12530 [Cyanobacteria bacterium P01_G01_bin.54]
MHWNIHANCQGTDFSGVYTGIKGDLGEKTREMAKRLLANPRIWGAFYIVIVLFFMELYYRKWNFSPDSFIVHQELNLFPISSTSTSPREKDRQSRPIKIPELSKIQAEVNLLTKEIDSESSKIDSLKEKQDSLDEELDKLFDENAQIREKNIEKFEEKELSDLDNRINEAERDIKNLELITEERSDLFFDYGYAIMISKLEVDLANLELERANKALEVSNKIVDEWGEFGNKELSRQLHLMHDERLEISEEIHETHLRMLTAQRNLNKSLDSWYSARVSALGRIDFLYYSIGISTTTTFGDIVANSHFIRLAVSIQLVLSVIAAAGFTNSLLPEKS